MKAFKTYPHKFPLYQAINTAVARRAVVERMRPDHDLGIRISTNTSSNVFEDKVLEERRAKNRVKELIKNGGLADHDELLGFLIGRMKPDTYIYALGDALDKLSAEALGYGLMEALHKRDELAIQLILGCGRPINFDVVDGNGNTPLGVALQPGILDCDRVLDGFIIAAVKSGEIKAVRVLIERLGLVGHIVDENGMTLLMLAINLADKAKAKEMTRLVAGEALSVHARDKNGLTALAMAAKRGLHSIVKLLLDKRAAVDARDLQGNTPLMCAVKNGKVDIVKTLIVHGADVDAISAAGETILEQAPSQQVTDLLSEYDAYSVSKAIGNNMPTKALQLAAKGAKHNTEQDVVDFLKSLLSDGADPYKAGLIKKEEGEIVIDESIQDKGVRGVIIGYVAAEKEFKEKFVDHIVDRMKKGAIILDNLQEEVKKRVDQVLAEDRRGKFAGCIKDRAFESFAPDIKLAFIDNFIITIKALLRISTQEAAFEERVLLKVKEQLNIAIQKMRVFELLSEELEQELEVFEKESSEQNNAAGWTARILAAIPGPASFRGA